ncbi:hypothetical protein FRAHR75_970005 [Frankia sp. Hr75.2]|nr:hypothetical protein FRAHR75_970005 [Frankia sp. Hr75.2]
MNRGPGLDGVAVVVADVRDGEDPPVDVDGLGLGGGADLEREAGRPAGQVVVVAEDQRGGAGSALIMALRQLGSAVGVAVLGAVYRAHLDIDGLCHPRRPMRRDGVSRPASPWAHQRGSEDLLRSARAAFVHGMDTTLWICATLGTATLILTLLALPGQHTPITRPRPSPHLNRRQERADARTSKRRLSRA